MKARAPGSSPGMVRDTRAESSRLLRRGWVRLVGVLLGTITGPALLACLVLRRRTLGPAERVWQWDLRRLERFFRATAAEDADSGLTGVGPWRIAVHAGLSFAAGYCASYLTFLLILMTGGVIGQLLFEGPASTVSLNFVTWQVSQPVALVGWIYVLTAAAALWAFAEAASWLLVRWVGRTLPLERAGSVEERIGQLITTRRGVVRAIDDERRRIERDLHDGVQQQAISLSMLLARARRSRDPEKVRELLERAHSQSQDLIAEMRQVSWQVYPAALDDLGLNQALTVVAQNAPLRVELRDSLTARPAPEAESAAYFVAREAITNAVKHASATAVALELSPVSRRQGAVLRVVVSDDGSGGADPLGSGLQGLSRRVEALDGDFTVSSPAGGPTVITAEIPYD